MIKFTIRQLEYFEALVQTGHFGRAAALAGVTQPALSAQIAEMEQRLQCKLFERGSRAVRLTEEARQLQPRIERVLGELRELGGVAQRGRSAMHGRFRLGIIPTVAPYLLPRLLPDLRRLYPDLVVELREAITDTLIADTAEGRLDGFIAALPIEHPRLVRDELFTDRFLLAVPRDDAGFVSPPVPPESPALERLMLLEDGHCMREQALAVCGKVRPVAMANYSATSLTTLLHMVAHGHGVTLIPEMATTADRALPDLRIVPFAEPVPSRRICLAWRANGSRQEECRQLAQLVRSIAVSDDPGQMQSEPDPHDREEKIAKGEDRPAIPQTV
ncbi:MAG: hydrogen peroxide-inducible genes activator [Rhizobiaceae bacterium]|nr:hydrogen peroxide-inducible genes activator [Rhizobiaceae bacterium]